MIQVNNTATYDDCCTWVEKIFGEAERQQFVNHVYRIRSFLSLVDELQANNTE